jgi:hypothetical protein
LFIDIRTHIIALVAVFLALGIGILIGVDMIGGQGLISQEKALAARLEADFDRLRSQNNALSTELTSEERNMSAEEAFANQAATALVTGRLAGSRVALVITQEGFQDPSLISILRAAGAQVGPVVVLNPSGSISSAVWQEAETALGAASPSAVYGALAAAAATGLTTGNWSKADVKVPIWQVSGDLSLPVQGAVVVCGGNQAVDPSLEAFTVPLVEALKKAGVTVVAGETTNVLVSHIPEMESLGVTTVDDLDLTPGLVSAVLGLDGVQGNFGVKATASRLMPELPPQPHP